MTLGVPGTGPYGEIRSLREEIRSHKYQLKNFVSESHRSKLRNRLIVRIAVCQARIKTILRQEKEKKTSDA